MMRHHLTALSLLLGLAACSSRPADSAAGSADSSGTMAPAGSPSPAASAELRDAHGRSLGTLTLTDTTGGIHIQGRLTGIPPGEHGFHVHAVGQCDGPGFTSAGGHWNPTGASHGLQNPKGPHDGDLPNLVAGADSVASVDVTTPGGSLRGTDALLDADGAAIVIHAGPDDNHTDPAGASGPRIACGAIRAP